MYIIPSIIHQCEQAEKEIAGLLSQQQALLSETLDTLATYATIISQVKAYLLFFVSWTVVAH